MIFEKILPDIDQNLQQHLPQPAADEYSISVAFTGHNGAIAIGKGDKVLEVIELERFINVKNFDFTFRELHDKENNEYYQTQIDKAIGVLSTLRDYVTRKYTDSFKFGVYVDRTYSPLISENSFRLKFQEYFKASNWYFVRHHIAHAAGAFYQSPYNKALVLTIDGGSMDGPNNAFIFNRHGDQEYLGSLRKYFGKSYSLFGQALRDIKLPPCGYSLIYPGKIMGLAGYGKVIPELKRAIKSFLINKKTSELTPYLDTSILDPKNYRQPEFCKKYYQEKSIPGQQGYDLAASLQVAFEEVYISYLKPIMDEYADLPVCLGGGCALNIPLNTRWVEEYKKDVFVPPDPSDCGLALGGLLFLLRPNEPYSTPYSGSGLLDLDMLGTYISEECTLYKSKYTIIDIKDNNNPIIELLKQDKIIGVARGRAERGPRALGNRSIICWVNNPDMKDIINAKVKFREWFRPFAPVVREEEVSKYFEWEGESRYMSFSPKVREEWVERIKPIVHIDGTARVQTITKEQNEFLYSLLGELDPGVLLNTSFNVDSKPIISTVKDAFRVLKETKLDAIIIENTLILKNEVN